MRRCCVATAIACLVMVALAPAPSSAMDLQHAKSAGYLGERPDGFIGLVRQDAPPEARQIMQDTNAARRQQYSTYAGKSGRSVTAVGAFFGKSLIERVRPGEFVMDPSGRWVKR